MERGGDDVEEKTLSPNKEMRGRGKWGRGNEEGTALNYVPVCTEIIVGSSIIANILIMKVPWELGLKLAI